MPETNEIATMLLTSGLASGGVGTVVWYFVKRLIKRIDDIEKILNNPDPKNPGLVTQMALNEERDQGFRDKFETHLNTHKGVKDDVKKTLKEFEAKMDLKYKQK